MTAVVTRPGPGQRGPGQPGRRPARLARPGPPPPPGAPGRGGANQPSPFVAIGAELALVVATAAAGLGLARLFADGAFVGPVLLAAVGGHATAWVCRKRGLGLLPSALISLGGLLLALSWLVEARTTTMLVPTRATWDAIQADLLSAWERFGEVKAPTPSLPGFVLASVAATWLTATTSDFFAFRVRARFEAMAPGFTLFVFGSILGADRLRLPTTALYLAAVLGFLLWSEAARTAGAGAWFGGRARQGDAALLKAGAGLGAAALAAAVLVGPHLPGAGSAGLVSWRDTKEGSNRSRVTVSPLVDIRGRIVDQSDVEMFTVQADSEHYWRLTSLDRFNGTIWSSLGTYQPTKGDLPGTAVGRPVNQDYAIGPLGTIWLPAAYRAERVENVKGARFDRDSGSLLAESDTADGLRYQVLSMAPELTAAALATASPDVPPAIADDYLALPGAMPAEVADLARNVTAGAATGYDKARRLQDWFRQNFVYDLTVPAGHDNDAMLAFLAAKRGYCEQFAGTYAAMARSLGIPARVAVGFVAGTLGADGRYHVAGRDAHAWPEVYLGGFGWVAFEPTPGQGRNAPGTAAYTGVGAPEDNTQPGANAPTTTAPTTVPGGADTTLPDQEPQDDFTPGRQAGGGGNRLLTALKLLAAAGLLYVVAVPLAQQAVLRRRRRSAASPSAQVLTAWQEAQETLTRAGHPRRRSETASEFAHRAAPAIPASAAELAVLAGVTDMAGFSARGLTAEAVPAARHAATAVALEVRAQTSPARRVVWALDPRPVVAGRAKRSPTPPS